MKRHVLIAITLFSVYGFSYATLSIPVFIEGKKSPIPAKELNDKLKEAGELLISESVILHSNQSKHTMRENLEKFDTYLEKALLKLGKQYKGTRRLTSNYPSENDTKDLKTCYTGTPRDVLNIVQNLVDTEYSEQLQILGYRYKQEKAVMADDSEKKELEAHLQEKSKLWREWQGKGEAMLLLSAVSDSGDDVNDSLIYRCRE